MKNARTRCPAGTLIPCLSVLLWVGGCSNPPPAAPENTAARNAKSLDAGLVRVDALVVRSGQVQCRPVQLSSVPELLEVTGRIGTDENRTSRIGSIVDGRVAQVFANVGDRVKQGQLLLQIVSVEVHDARSEFAKAQAELSRRKSELEFARNAHARAQRLYQLKAGSLENLQRAEADLRSAEYAITSAQAEINRVEEHLTHLGLSAEGALEEYGRDKKEKEAGKDAAWEADELVPVFAPISGTVLKRFISQGVVVGSTSDLIILSDLGTLWVNAEVPEKHLAALKLGRRVSIRVQAYGDRVFEGRITFISDSLNPDTRTVQVRCETLNTEGLLKPEMYATIGFEVGEPRQAMLIPEGAIQDVNGQAAVFVGESENAFRLRPIRSGKKLGGDIEILEGLKPGDCVAGTGSFILKSELLKKSLSPD